jgi:hypothetical protein
MALELLADLLPGLTGGGGLGSQAAGLLRRGAPGPEAAALDAHHGLLQQHFTTIEAALANLPPAARDHLAGDPRPCPPLDTGPDAPLDGVILRLLDALAPWNEAARQLAVALGRFLEDVPRLLARRRLPLGRGFEALREERWRRRVALLPCRSGLLTTLHRHCRLLLEEPDEGTAAIERDLGRPLDDEERAWLEAERRVATLRFVREHKTEDGHIRWYVRPDPRHGTVLERLGAHGHWAVCGAADAASLARVGTAVERVAGARDTRGFCAVVVGDAGSCPEGGVTAGHAAAFRLPAHLLAETDRLTLRGEVRRLLEPVGAGAADLLRTALAPGTAAAANGQSRPHLELIERDGGLSLRARNESGEEGDVARLPGDATDDVLLDFLDRLFRIADWTVPVDRVRAASACGPAVAWARAALRVHAASRDQGPRVRLVYVPSAIPHELGGVPEIGAAFLRDHLERAGARVDVVQLPRTEFEGRLVELLGADVVGIGVYVHNRDDVAELVRQLRDAGFVGRIVLGGPETRNSEAVQESIPGWDAIVRGEGEEVLPRVLEVFDHLDRGNWQEALARARALRGVALRYGRAVLLCDTAARNRAETISCPLPFDWARGSPERRVKMNFTRGCPYWCSFCPNHQGRAFGSGAVEELWRYSVQAVADDLPLPADVEKAVAQVIQDRLGVAAPPRLRLALHLLWRGPLTSDILRAVVGALRPVIDARVWEDGARLASLVSLRRTVAEQIDNLGSGPVLPRQGKETWLVAKTAVLASRQLWRHEGSQPDLVRGLARPSPFVIETSEDNTLVNRKQIAAYLRQRKHYGLAGDFVFNPGQNTIQDLLRGPDRTEANEDYIALLADENPFAVALGTDGPSNAILRQNQKPLYGVAGVLAVNKALGRYARRVANNYILLTPETDLLEAVESFILFLLLPVPWRDYGGSINLRVITEETTLATDEGLLFAPDGVGHHVPFRFPELQRLLDRWGLTPEVPARRLRPLLWRILENDAEVAAVLRLLVRRWERNFDDDPEIAALPLLVGEELQGAESVAHALWRLGDRIQADAFVDGRTVATFRNLAQRRPVAVALHRSK